MAEIEEQVSATFSKVFSASDWRLFKRIAELNFSDAANLLMKHMDIEESFQLLARNSRKRLLIGVGTELLLKAVYLKCGYLINKPPRKSGLPFPFTTRDLGGIQLLADKTFMLDDLIKNLAKVAQVQNIEMVTRGLTIARIFRNKEGHGVTNRHKFDPTNYTDIAASITEMYRDVFSETLTVRFAMAPDEKPLWRISPIGKPAF